MMQEPLEDFHTDTEREFIHLSSWFEETTTNWKKQGWVPNPGEREMMRSVQEIKGNVMTMAAKLNEDAEEVARKKDAELKKVNEPCPRCGKKNRSRVIGATKNRHGYTVRKLHCSRCKIAYHDYMPIEEDEWMKCVDNFITELEKVRDDSTTYAEKFDIPTKEVEQQHEGFIAMQATISQEQENKAKHQQIEDQLQEILKSMTELNTASKCAGKAGTTQAVWPEVFASQKPPFFVFFFTNG